MFIDNGNDHIIDTTILRDSQGNYYRASAASSTIRVEKCTDSSQWLTNQSVWETQGFIRISPGYTPGLEGPELFAYNQDDWKEVDGQKVETYGPAGGQQRRCGICSLLHHGYRQRQMGENRRQ